MIKVMSVGQGEWAVENVLLPATGKPT